MLLLQKMLTLSQHCAILVVRSDTYARSHQGSPHRPRPFVANYEVGRNEPIDAIISLICREFHVDERWLRTGDGKMFTATTRDEEIMDFVGRATIGAGDDFKRRFLLALARLPEERWADIEDFARQITAENAKEEQD